MGAVKRTHPYSRMMGQAVKILKRINRQLVSCKIVLIDADGNIVWRANDKGRQRMGKRKDRHIEKA